MWKTLIYLAFSLQSFQIVLSQDSSSDSYDVCNIDDNDAASDACAMKSAFGGSSAFPELIPEFNPAGALYVQYGSLVVGGAQQLSPSRVYFKPQLSLSLVDSLTAGMGISSSSQKYTAACVDFQEASGANQLIWVQTGLVADGESGILSPTVQPALPYASPDPPPNTGTHEYVFMIFKESTALLGADLRSGAVFSGPMNINVLGGQTQLDKSLVAASYFKARYDGQSINGQKPGTLTTKQNIAQPKAAVQASAQTTPQVVSTEDQIDNATGQAETAARSVEKPVATPIVQSSRTQTAQRNYQDLCDLDNDAAADGCSMTSAFGGSSITPNIVPTFKPLGALYVQYGNVILGGAQQMAPTRVQNQPHLKFSVGISDYEVTGKRYFLLLVDTVVKTTQVSVSWAQAGVTIDKDTETLVVPSDQSAHCKYTSPNPGLGGDPRNYIFLLFEQPSGFTIPNQFSGLLSSINPSNHDRVTMDLNAFISATGFGSPIGGSFFKSTKSHSGNHRRSHRDSVRTDQI